MRVLNLGAGVQSTAVYLLMCEGRVAPADHAIFADVQEEPQAVYAHLEWLKTLDGPPIRIVTKGKLGHDLINGTNSTGRRFASIPAFTRSGGMVRRQCSSEYKIEPIEREIKRGILGLKPRQRVPKGVEITQVFGISFDERSRASRIFERYNFNESNWRCEFPLVDMRWSRRDCLAYLENRAPHPVPRSACVFCPFHSDAEWVRLRDDDPDGWRRAVEIDHAIRSKHSRASQGMHDDLFVHRDRVPLDQVQFLPDVQPKLSFNDECEGVCGV